MKYLPYLISVLLLAMIGCKTQNQAEVTSPDQEKLDNEKAFASGSDCEDLNINLFCVNGLSSIKFGDSLIFKTLNLEGIGEKDSIMDQISDTDTISWNIKTLSYPNGKVILESDFDLFLFLSRIRIETPDLKNMHDIGVGNTLADLKKKYSRLVVSPYRDMEVIEISIEENYNAYFHFSNPRNKLLPDETKDYTIEDLPETLQIVRVVLWDRKVG